MASKPLDQETLTELQQTSYRKNFGLRNIRYKEEPSQKLISRSLVRGYSTDELRLGWPTRNNKRV